MEEAKLDLLSKGQRRALNDALDGKNIFITGAGGVGKSYLVHLIKTELEKMGKEVALTSSTGISAVNIGGGTIHSFCGTGTRRSPRELKNVPKDTLFKIKMYNGHYNVVIIDEISMIPGDQIDMINQWFQKIYGSKLPFGGVQMIFVGDFLQLPVVIKDDDTIENKYAFQAEAWQLYGVREHFLTKVFRQEDEDTQYYLNCIRFGKINQAVLDYFNTRVGVRLPDPEPTELYPLKSSVSYINFDRLNSLEGEEYEYDAKFGGDEKWQEALAKNVIAEVTVYLKVGAKVLFIRNNPEEGYYNGMGGVVKECHDKTVVVETIDGETIEVEYEQWEKRDNKGKVVATMKQIPLILGWAITIHKSQGMTLDYMTCDLSRCFECGQAYVALSRMKSMEGLSIKKPIRKKDIKTDRTVVSYYRRLFNKIKAQRKAESCQN